MESSSQKAATFAAPNYARRVVREQAVAACFTGNVAASIEIARR
jgi:hypothetical protein